MRQFFFLKGYLSTWVGSGDIFGLLIMGESLWSSRAVVWNGPSSLAISRFGLDCFLRLALDISEDVFMMNLWNSSGEAPLPWYNSPNISRLVLAHQYSQPTRSNFVHSLGSKRKNDTISWDHANLFKCLSVSFH